jgi:hypothetical protein
MRENGTIAFSSSKPVREKKGERNPIGSTNKKEKVASACVCVSVCLCLRHSRESSSLFETVQGRAKEMDGRERQLNFPSPFPLCLFAEGVPLVLVPFQPKLCYGHSSLQTHKYFPEHRHFMQGILRY